MPTVFSPKGILGKAESTVLGEDESTGKKVLALGVIGVLGFFGIKTVDKIIEEFRD